MMGKMIMVNIGGGNAGLWPCNDQIHSYDCGFGLVLDLECLHSAMKCADNILGRQAKICQIILREWIHSQI